MLQFSKITKGLSSLISSLEGQEEEDKTRGEDRNREFKERM